MVGTGRYLQRQRDMYNSVLYYYIVPLPLSCMHSDFILKLKKLMQVFLLRVLLVKRPDMMEPTFFAQYQFVCNIISTNQVDMPGTKNFDVGANTVPWGVISVLGPRQK